MPSLFVPLDDIGVQPIHVIPNVGPRHYCDKTCWCHPDIDNAFEFLLGEHMALIYIHNVSH